MKEPEPSEPVPPTVTGDEKRPGGSLDLDHVNPLQQAILQRVRDAEARGHWLPKMTPAQWIVSTLIAVVLVALIFNVVDAGLTAFQKFAEVSMRSGRPPPAEPAAAPAAEAVPPVVDVSKPFAVIVVPEELPAQPAAEPPQPQ